MTRKELLALVIFVKYLGIICIAENSWLGQIMHPYGG